MVYIATCKVEVLVEYITNSGRMQSLAVMLVLGLGLGLKAKFCGLGLGLAIGWPWPWDCGLGLGLRGLALAKNSRPKSWRTTMFTMNFHRLENDTVMGKTVNLR